MQRGHGVVALADALGEHARADVAVVLEQREQQFVLAREAAVERLERHVGARRDLRNGERGAARLVGELARGSNAPFHALDVTGAGVGQGSAQRSVLPTGRPGPGACHNRVRRIGECHSPNTIGPFAARCKGEPGYLGGSGVSEGRR